MEKKELLSAMIDQLCELVQTTTITEIASDLESFKIHADHLCASVQAFSALVRISELASKENKNSEVSK